MTHRAATANAVLLGIGAWVLALTGCGGPSKDTGTLPSTTTTYSTPITTSTPACEPGGDLPYTQWSDEVVCALRNLTAEDGVNVREGTLRWLTEELCGDLILQLGTCFGNHPASPYGMFDFPEDSLGWNAGSPLARYRRAQHEAIIYIGKPPPNARYFGFTNYQSDRYDGPLNPRLSTFGSMTPTINMMDMQVAQANSAPFQAYTVVIFTANTQTADRVTALLTPMLEAGGYDAGIINVNPIAYVEEADAEALRNDPSYDPDSIVRLDMGYHEDADTYLGLLRVGAVENGEHPFFDPAQIEAGLFKLAFEDPPEYAPFVYPHLPPEDHTGEVPGEAVTDGVDRVADEIEATRSPEGSEVLRADFFNRPQKSGFKCINATPGHPTCGANNDDARYIQPGKLFKLPDVGNGRCSVFVVGAIHDEVGLRSPNAPQVTYSTLSLHNAEYTFGLTSLVDRDLEGSYAFYFPANAVGLTADQQASIYVHRFSRVCVAGEPYCTVVPTGVPGVGPNESFDFLARAYLNKTSNTAPHQDSVVAPQLIAWADSIDQVDDVTVLNCPD